MSGRGHTPQPFEVRLFERIDFAGICWEWTGSPGNSGYGVISLGGRGGRQIPAHRAVWLTLVGPIEVGLELDHLCRNKLCVNPDHLEPVTHAVNVSRGSAGALLRARAARIRSCPQGHPYSAENTYRDPSGARHCRECGRQQWRIWNEKRTAA